ncbi:MAG: hypothetical protein P4L43_10040 [Syntrophobacteraceae bacterium]|nr:hypothetical protein [Syntrophobacteraceae bacterium]
MGFLVLHPYVMFVQWIISPHPRDLWDYHLFGPLMLSMGIAFALFGAMIGLLIGSAVQRGKSLVFSINEQEKKEIALKAVYDPMVTLSHYLLNANMIIGGKVRRCQKKAGEQEVFECLEVIEKQGRTIDAALKSLRSLVDVNTAGHTSDGTLWAYGDNMYGQSEDGTTTDRSSPEQIGTGNGWMSVSVAVGIPVTRPPPRRSVRAELPHTAPTSSD